MEETENVKVPHLLVSDVENIFFFLLLLYIPALVKSLYHFAHFIIPFFFFFFFCRCGSRILYAPVAMGSPNFSVSFHQVKALMKMSLAKEGVSGINEFLI